MFDELLAQIDHAVATRCYLLALFGALSVPDIGGAVDAENGMASGADYAKWFDTYMGPKGYDQPPGPRGFGGEPIFTGFDCYYFRCSLLHQGSTVPHSPKATHRRVAFIEPGAAASSHRGRSYLPGPPREPVVSLDLPRFCAEMTASGREWLSVAGATPRFQTNMVKCVQRYPDGFPGLIKNAPVIA